MGTIGFDAGKRVKGRKRHAAVDSLGYPMALVVTGAQVQDSQPAAVAQLFVRLRQMLQRAARRLGRWPKLHEVTGDKSYRGTADLWAKQLGFSLRAVGRSGRGFETLPKRWVIDWSFSWLFNFRRLLFDLARVEQELTQLSMPFLDFYDGWATFGNTGRAAIEPE